MSYIRLTLAAVLLGCTAHAQVVAPSSLGVSMGHLHLNSADPDASRKLWIDVFGAKAAKVGPLDIVEIPGCLIFINKAEPTAGTEGSIVNHVGIKVSDLQAVLKNVEAAPIKIVSRNDRQAMLTLPDGLRLELTDDKTQTVPVAFHHIHYYASDLEPMRAWYAEKFGAIPGKRDKFEAADLPGVNLSFTKTGTALPGTKGRTLDHIGFEVHDLAAFTKRLEAQGVKFDIPYRQVPKLGIAIAFLTDPWGTYIELTEGLSKVQ